MANRLQHETSPYLQQHADNPVDWFPWGEEALAKAQAENKPILVSIGYSACHWCHVMEHESFESEEVAELMNEHFISIKIDREERPDIDQIYMDALQTMGLHGGWPLNVFCTPEGKPFYGGTYFPKEHWKNVLQQIQQAYQFQLKELEASAEGFVRSLQQSDIQKYGFHKEDHTFDLPNAAQAIAKLHEHMDTTWGGLSKVPKFPMPSIWLFLLRAYALTKNPIALEDTLRTLEKMAMGGIYDTLGGGFARYSTDGEWFAPHFEKMLYDNGQLLSLYSEAYLIHRSPLFKQVIEETISWLKRDMLSNEGGFYSAQDADSEGVEGKYYCWHYEEIAEALPEDLALVCDYYNIQQEGNWEENRNILFRRWSDEAFAAKHDLPLTTLQAKIQHWKNILFSIRDPREHPGLDDKQLASWNAMALKGLCDAYKALGDESILHLAKMNAEFITGKLIQNHRLSHTYQRSNESGPAFMEDYAFVIDALLALYECTFHEEWLWQAVQLTNTVIEEFYDEEESMFHYTSSNGESLIARKKEIFDNVIPSSNSVMARNLYKLGIVLSNEDWIHQAKKMASRVKEAFLLEPSFLAHWGCLMTDLMQPTVELAISGPLALEYRKKIEQVYVPNKVICGTTLSSQLPLLEGRLPKNDKTILYWCENKTCLQPTEDIEQILLQLQQL